MSGTSSREAIGRGAGIVLAPLTSVGIAIRRARLFYRHLIAPGYTLEFRDGTTGREITGCDWKTSLGITTRQLLDLVVRL